MTAFDEQCDWCEEVLQPYLDRELTEAEMREAQSHLDACPSCKTRYKFEEGLRLKMHAVVEPMEPALKQKLSELRLEL